MFALLSTRFRRWLLLAVGVPVAAWLMDRVGESMERRRGTSRTSRGLRQTSAWLRDARPGRRRRRVGW